MIQNAEDNSYPEGQEPQLLFSLAAGDPTATGTPVEGANMTLGLFNNEVGFREENVDALCSVGESQELPVCSVNQVCEGRKVPT